MTILGWFTVNLSKHSLGQSELAKVLIKMNLDMPKNGRLMP
jgi:hypothetical protein